MIAPVFVAFTMLTTVLVGGQRYPTSAWTTGSRSTHSSTPAVPSGTPIDAAAKPWRWCTLKDAARARHLQHGNIVIRSGIKLRITTGCLLFAGTSAPERGLAAYQHPLKRSLSDYGVGLIDLPRW